MRSSCLPWAIVTIVILILFILGAVVPWMTDQLSNFMSFLP